LFVAGRVPRAARGGQANGHVQNGIIDMVVFVTLVFFVVDKS
jgi:hypothetical protein